MVNILALYPYRDSDHDNWVFDDERTGLHREPFVMGITDMITRVVTARGIKDANDGFTLAFAADPFEGHDASLEWQRSEQGGGDWYAGDILGEAMEGWLCPALLLYFRTPPRRLYVRCDPLEPGVNPRWDPSPGTGRRFVDAGSGEDVRSR